MQKTEKNEFLQLFQKMIDYGLLGIYKRQKMTEKASDSSFVPALARAGAMGAFLNLKFDLEVDGEGILPETEYEIFHMFEFPLRRMIDQLPEPFRTLVMENTEYYEAEALMEDTGRGKVILTEDGYLMLSDRRFFKAKDRIDQLREYNGQRIFEELCRDGDHDTYVENRHFLEQAENVYIPETAGHQNEEQRRFMKKYGDLFALCYEKNDRITLFRCKRCGMILREYQNGVFSCLSKKCNAMLEQKQEIEMHGPGWVLNDIAARNIYYPGRLEQKTQELLDEAVTSKTVESYELWPGKWEGQVDTWDFKVQLSGGRILVVDAKDVESPHWLIEDPREYLENAEFIYVVPNDRSKEYLDQVNHHKKVLGKASCLRIKEFAKLIGER